MFTESAGLHDAIYSFKDYAGEAAQIADLVRAAHPAARTVLDVACGTGEHARHLAASHGFEVDGLDLDASLLGVALGEPWFAPGVLEDGRVMRQSGTYRGRAVERVSHGRLQEPQA